MLPAAWVCLQPLPGWWDRGPTYGTAAAWRRFSEASPEASPKWRNFLDSGRGRDIRHSSCCCGHDAGRRPEWMLGTHVWDPTHLTYNTRCAEASPSARFRPDQNICWPPFPAGFRWSLVDVRRIGMSECQNCQNVSNVRMS